jgi:hypothetical protein
LSPKFSLSVAALAALDLFIPAAVGLAVSKQIWLLLCHQALRLQ